MEEKIEIRDRREKGWFYINNEFIDHYARYVGCYGVVVYGVLCRHANKDEKCWPSYKTLKEKLGISLESINRGIKSLEKYNIISIERRGKTNEAGRASNIYTLLDKKKWAKLFDSVLRNQY